MSWMDDGGFEMQTFTAQDGRKMARMVFRTSTGQTCITLTKTEVQRIRRECTRTLKQLDGKDEMTDHDHRLEDDRRPLTAAQRTQKTIACALAAAITAAASMWGLVWTLAAAMDGTLSILHIAVTSVCGILATTFGDIAERELPNL